MSRPTLVRRSTWGDTYGWLLSIPAVLILCICWLIIYKLIRIRRAKWERLNQQKIANTPPRLEVTIPTTSMSSLKKALGIASRTNDTQEPPQELQTMLTTRHQSDLSLRNLENPPNTAPIVEKEVTLPDKAKLHSISQPQSSPAQSVRNNTSLQQFLSQYPRNTPSPSVKAEAASAPPSGSVGRRTPLFKTRLPFKISTTRKEKLPQSSIENIEGQEFVSSESGLKAPTGDQPHQTHHDSQDTFPPNVHMESFSITDHDQDNDDLYADPPERKR